MISDKYLLAFGYELQHNQCGHDQQGYFVSAKTYFRSKDDTRLVVQITKPSAAMEGEVTKGDEVNDRNLL